MSVQAHSQHHPAISANAATAVVQTSSGKVHGYVRRDIYTFKGIPYGGAERFMLAERPGIWEGIRNCLAYGKTGRQCGRFGYGYGAKMGS